MPGHYSVDELLKLRASPLICRPPNLPATEEWMGAPESSARRPVSRPAKDEATPGDTFQKRPTLLDQRRTTTDPERIVLGPPRRSFASSNARAGGKGQDGLDEKDRTTFGDRTRNGDDAEPRHHDRKHPPTNGRFGSRQDEELEPEGRRDYDRRQKWTPRDGNDQEQEPLEDTARGTRRYTESRARMAQSWFRKDNGAPDEDKAPDWRRSKDRDWDRDRYSKAEAEPEWMDATEPEEPFQPRTQDDFQKWKEQMKANGKASMGKIDTAIASPPPEEKPARRVVSAAEPDDSMDKFLARYESHEQKAATVKAHGKTRFANLFSPTLEQPKQPEFPAQTPTTERPGSAQAADTSHDADQAGFAKIMEMLKGRSNNPTPQAQEPPKQRTPLYARGADQQPEPSNRAAQNDVFTLLGAEIKSPPPHQHQHQSESTNQLMNLFGGQNKAAYQHQSEQTRMLPIPQRHIETQSPVELPAHSRQQPSINRDEVLINLLKQANLAPKPQPQPPAGSGMFASMADQSNRMPPVTRAAAISPVQSEQQHFRRDGRASMVDDSPVSIYPSEQPQEPLRRRPTNGGQPPYTEDPLIALLRGQQPPMPRQAQQPPQGYPPGLQRPPGFDQTRPMPSMNYAPQQPPPHQQQSAPRQQALPPGLANMPRGMSGAQYGQPPQVPSQQQPPQQRQAMQQQPQRKYTNDSGPPHLPPGMYPPPGFMAAGPPPPGFSGAMANHPVNRFGGELPGAQQRAYMEMYGEVGGRAPVMRGNGSGGMPPYR